MSDYQPPSLQGQISQDDGRSSGVKEINLFSIIEFYWRFKSIIAVGTALGVLGSIGFWLAKAKSREQQPDLAPYHMAAEVKMAASDQSTLARTAAQFNSFINTDLGASTFYSSLAETNRQEPATKGWASKQLSGNGIVKGMEVAGANVILNLLLDDDSMNLEKSIPLALNATAEAFNNEIFQKKIDLAAELEEVQSDCSAIALSSLRIFEQYAKLSPNIQSSVVAGIANSLVKCEDPTAIGFLLAPAPDEQPLKATLLSRYDMAFKKILNIKASLASVAKLSNAEFVAQISAFGTVTNLRKTVSPTTWNAPRTNVLNSLPTVLFSGALAGIIFGTLMAYIRAFWIKNGNRIRQICSANY